jgi:hypothetical protein
MDSLISQFNKLNLSDDKDIENLITILDDLRLTDDSNPIINHMYHFLLALSVKGRCNIKSNKIEIFPYIY